MMIVTLDLSDDRICAAVLELQRASYAIEAALIAFDQIPALSETALSLGRSRDTFLGCVQTGESSISLVGAISFHIADQTIEISRLVVHPDWFQRGIATALLSALEDRYQDIRAIRVETASTNVPAVRLYTKLGYGELSRREVEGGLLIRRFEKGLV